MNCQKWLERSDGKAAGEGELIAVSAHREIPIKVTAWIDEDVAPLVAALNEFPDLLTVDSCQGNGEGAYVLFRFRGNSEAAAHFASQLADELGESAPYLLQAEWRPGADDPLLALSCPADAVPGLAEAVSACRTRLSDDGTRDTEPRNSTRNRHHRAAGLFGGGTRRCSS